MKVVNNIEPKVESKAIQAPFTKALTLLLVAGKMFAGYDITWFQCFLPWIILVGLTILEKVFAWVAKKAEDEVQLN